MIPAAVWLQAADGAVARVGDVDVALAIDGDAGGEGKARVRSGAIARACRLRLAGDGRDGGGFRVDLADQVIAGVGDIQVAGRVDGCAAWVAETGGPPSGIGGSR